MINKLENWLLSKIQRRCAHPDRMVACDILEGCSDFKIKYCRRCGAVSISYPNQLGYEWRRPDPFLWSGFKKDLGKDTNSLREIG